MYNRSLGLQDAPKVRYIIKQERIKKNVVEKAPREEEAEKKENEKEEKEEEEEVVDEEGDEDEDDEEENDVEEDVDDADSDQNEILDEKIDNKRSGKKNIEDKLKEVREKLRNKMKNMANEGSDVATSNVSVSNNSNDIITIKLGYRHILFSFLYTIMKRKLQILTKHIHPLVYIVVLFFTPTRRRKQANS